MNIFDTHAHFPEDPNKTATLLERASAAGVSRLMAVGGSPELNRAALLAASLADGTRPAPSVFLALGMDRDQTSATGAACPKYDFSAVIDNRKRISAIGEIGLDFHYAPEVSISDQANVASGSYSGRYDRGHQIPAADRKCSQEMMNQTFYATNMTPQYYSFNQNVWASLEGKVRNQICADTLYVVTGAWFEGDHDSSIASSASDRSGKECPTPTYYFKALLRTHSGRTGLAISDVKDASKLRAIALWMKHSNTGEDTAIAKSDCITIDELESKIGFDLFPMIDDSIEQTVEQTIDTSSWGLSLK